MTSTAAFFHLRALRAVLDGTAEAPLADDGALARSVFPQPYVTAGALLWPQEHAHRVLHEWARWAAAAPDDVTSAARLVRFPRLPGVPPQLRGRAFVCVEVAIPGEPWVALGRLAALRRLEPEIDTVELSGPAGVPAMHLGLGLPPAALGGHLALHSVPPKAIEAFVAVAGPASGSPLASAALHHLGRAYALTAAGRPTDADHASRLEVRLDLLGDRLAPYAAGPSLVPVARTLATPQTTNGRMR
jgi:hypothetical protein